MANQPTGREVLNWAGGLLAVGVLVLFGYVVWVQANQEIPKSNENLFCAIVTGLIGLVTMVFGFFYGSSHQQKKQAETIDTLSKAATTPSIIAHPGDTVRTETSSETRVE